MLKLTSGAALLCAAGAVTAQAQRPCAAAPRELSRPGAREVALELADPLRGFRGVAADGATCDGAVAPLAAWDATLPYLPRATVRAFAPLARIALVGGVADPRGAGSAWLGRGANLLLRPGVSATVGPVSLVAAPELWIAGNRAYDILPSTTAARSSFASPFYPSPWSIDLPSRHGPDAWVQLAPGQSAIWVAAGPADAGAATSTQHWGPGRAGGLVLGPDAPGIPRFFVRTRDAVASPIGQWSATAFVGTLTESRYFDREPANDYRTLGAWMLAWSPGDSSALRVGLTHAVMRRGRLRGLPLVGGGDDEQMTSVFGEVGAAGRGSRVYAEVARAGPLPSLRRFLTVPYTGIAYLVGAEHLIPRDSGTWLLSVEAANLEQPTDVRGELTQDLYTSDAIPQGWTQRGRVLGYATGPGSNHAAIGVDWIAPRWSAGVFADRTRWNDDALYRQYLALAPRHDVTVRAGLRAGYVVGGAEVTLELSTGKRLNYMFQNTQFIYAYRTVDVAVPQLRIGFAPRPLAFR